MSKLTIVRGFNDVLPLDSYKWQFLESKVKLILDRYNYSETRLPIVERSELFHRSVGESSDIVSKETYDFQDRNGDSLTLRPEGTAGCVRMVIENNLATRGQTQKLWYCGPMFRYERPQKGRYRQFYQLGVEAYGFDGIAIDLEVIAIAWSLFKELGISEYVTLELNSLGSSLNRQEYTQALLQYLKPYHAELDEDSIKRLDKNPLRILDSKIEKTQKILANAPKLIDFIDHDLRLRFKQTCQYLDALGVRYKLNENLVRGLDYYTGLVFEWTTDKLGSQSAICAGGRYDGLVENLGGQKIAAIGFAIGMERLLLLLEDLGKLPNQDNACDVFFILDSAQLHQSLAIVENIRQELPQLKIDMDLKFGSFKSQFKKADKSGAKVAIIIGQDELDNGFAGIKFLQQNEEQQQVAFNELINFLER
ncbi:histidine--tRNA ligase [Francisella tularensis]|uniref:Histidine--tRNA ligase n=1 Tax=Francisella tularensis subsp. holarctica (strain OSU18) TaxID=393011 RepID=SYH_FRATO|nr:histidine--tRNA ligase [Francisella tularensis]Q0BK72.1 RecName: Full=Histidine--tRNA ligase; AltName: Full=Histidyl-tRNA synthetase; Short=HisRS [Francisella tularensis subsp. holarctica OSU18]ABI83512.1 histidine--tRNA ligase [Francisella tularensis subsp. holarctica OSU18]AJI52212.1 histidine--tRNA ligase [Francisella tularensis subsp. holarctica]AJI65553.1 histidine--tRNA ligase [Francisella tularensis subsp. holarctica]AZP06768.1 histidine--tRNA ligase [Francisella tularensis]AZP10288